MWHSGSHLLDVDLWGLRVAWLAATKAAWYQVSPWDALAEGYSRPAIDVQTLWAIIFQVLRAFLGVLLSAEGTSNWMLLCTYLAAFMYHQALFQIQVKGTSWTSLPPSPTISALSTVPLHWFSSNRYHSCTAVAGILLLCSSGAIQDSADADVLVQSHPFLGVCVCCGRADPFPKLRGLIRDTGHLQIPSAKCCF